ncbi:MAG: methyl-accepting chemotaxis protein [Gammaproteobacteria bacterium]|nr:methyl-accepting chemotaxis protein [Gammaproteobacteria bacterium]
MAEKRKLLRIKNDFQQRLILQTLSAVFISINVIVIYLFVGPLKSGVVRTDIIGPVIGIMEVIAFAIVYRFSLIASHRIAGPVFVLERALRRLAEGDLTQEVRLRKGDNFHDTVEIFNLAIADLRERVIRAKRAVSEPDNAEALEDARDALAEFKTEPAPSVVDVEQEVR